MLRTTSAWSVAGEVTRARSSPARTRERWRRKVKVTYSRFITVSRRNGVIATLMNVGSYTCLAMRTYASSDRTWGPRWSECAHARVFVCECAFMHASSVETTIAVISPSLLLP